MGKASRDKGARAERDLVARLMAADIHARRVPLSGAVAGFRGDVQLWAPTGPLVAECKIRGDGFRFLYALMADADLGFVRADRKEWLAVVPLPLLLKMWGARDG